MYHMNQPVRETLTMEIPLRKWLIERFVKQKEKENEAMEAAQRKAKAGAKRK